MNSELFGTVSSIIITLATFSAVLVAVWQVRAYAIAVAKSNSLPVASVVFNEFRSQGFRNHLLKVWNEALSVAPEGGFQALPVEYRESAYEVAYFFEHLGALVAYHLVPEDLVVDFSANAVVRSWRALEQFIQEERALRKRNSSVDLSVNFVSHFEYLTVLASRVDPHGKHIDDSIHERLGLQRFTP